jgi:hypothetical protein
VESAFIYPSYGVSQLTTVCLLSCSPLPGESTTNDICMAGLIVTCGTMAREDLFGQSLEIKEHPARVVTTEHQGKILITYGDSVVWSFEIDECQTWFVSQNQPYHTSCRAQ